MRTHAQNAEKYAQICAFTNQARQISHKIAQKNKRDATMHQAKRENAPEKLKKMHKDVQNDKKNNEKSTKKREKDREMCSAFTSTRPCDAQIK